MSKMTEIKINLESDLSKAREACREAVKYSWEMVKCGILTTDDRAAWDDISEKSDLVDLIKAKLIKAFPDWVDYERWDSDTDSEILDSDNESEHPSLDEEESDEDLRYNGDDLS